LEQAECQRPFRLTFNAEASTITAEPFTLPNTGPYPYDKPKLNSIRFTPVQIQAITSSLNEGLTCIVGPPGSGKTDVAVQVINLLYHNFPNQRTLLVTHSNQALNQLFEKIMALGERERESVCVCVCGSLIYLLPVLTDIEERHLLRLGHGESLLENDNDFGFNRLGRVEHMLARREEFLVEVARLAQSINVESDVASTCETATYFYLYHIKSRWEEFLHCLYVVQRNRARQQEREREQERERVCVCVCVLVLILT
jgi:intron-binding protein aquarius